MTSHKEPFALRVYILVLAATLLVILAASLPRDEAFVENLVPWLAMLALFAATEYAALNFHDDHIRWGLSASEAILLPMIVGFSFAEAVLGATLGVALVRVSSFRKSAFKEVFNVAQYGVAASAGAAFWHTYNDSTGEFTARNATVAVLSVIVFAVLTHVFVAIAVKTSKQGGFVEVLRGIGSPALLNLAGNITLGLFFAAAYLTAQWTIILFPVPLGALYFGYRAVVRQSRERERVENLHAASRALAASANFEDALLGFLKAMREIVSAVESVAVLNVNKQWVISSVRGGEIKQNFEPLGGGPLLELVEKLRAERSAFRMTEEDHTEAFFTAMGARGLVAVPLINDEEYAGTLVALDRVGAEEFSDSDARLLEALGNELVLTLDSYRLFAEVAEERERFQKIFAASKEGICLLDEGGVIRAWNPALARITGFDEEDILGEKWSERVLVRNRNHQRIEGLDIVSVPPDEELELVTRQGPPRWVAIMSGEVQTGDDEKSWVLLVRDITAEHELEESKSDFLSTISHELRTPLTTIKGSLQVLSRPNASPNTEIGRQMIEIMKRGSDRLERLVMNLLAVSQMETGAVQVFPDEVPLEELVRSRIGTILPEHPQVDLEVDESIVVRADKERLSQVIEHLLDNARKFGPESGRIAIEITKENGYARLTVRDEGPGIPKIDQERIFDRFVRLGHVLTRETQGPGVGLFIVKRSLEAMSGSVEVESDPNRGGSAFHVRIPLAHPMAAAEPTSA